jgi:glutaredoxin-like protein
MGMAFLSESDKTKITDMFFSLKNHVKMILFTKKIECPYCEETKQILNEVSKLHKNVSFSVYDISHSLARRRNIINVPAIIVEGREDYGIRFYGIPSGYEFTVLLEAIIDVSQSKSGLSDASIALLKQINKPVNLKVFVTPTCPHCPGAVRLIHQAAIESAHITAEMIEATEFPQLSKRFDVKRAPKTVVNEEFSFEGVQSEEQVIQYIMEAIKP